MEEQRDQRRKRTEIIAFVRRALPDGRSEVSEVRSVDLSEGGVFISVEDLTVFDLGEEVELMVDVGDDRYYDGKARVARSARVLSADASLSESGFGLMFLGANPDFTRAIRSRLD